MDLKKKLELTRKVMSSVRHSSTCYVFANQHVIDLENADRAIAEFDRYFAAHSSFSEDSKKAEEISKGDINTLKLVKAQKTYSDGFLLPDVMVGIVKSESGKFYGVTSMVIPENKKDRYLKERYYSLSAREETGAFKEMRTIFNEMIDGVIVASIDFRDESNLTYYGDSHYKRPNYVDATATGGIAEKIKETTAKLNARTRDEFVGMIAKDIQLHKKTVRLKRVESSLKNTESLKSMRTKTQKKIILANLKRRKIEAAGMSRIVEHMEKALNGESSFAIFTSEQGVSGTVAPQKNMKNYRELGKILNNLKNGAISLKGVWQGTAEPSYFVPAVDLNWAKMLSEKYNQWAFIYAGPETDGKVELWATDSIDKGEVNYSKVMSWDAYAVEGLSDPEGFSESPDKRKFSFYEGKDKDYGKVVQELNNWANQAIDSLPDHGGAEEEPVMEKKVASKKVTAMVSQEVTDAFKEVILWSTLDSSDEGDSIEEHLDAQYTVYDFSPEAEKKIKEILEKFFTDNAETIEEFKEEENVDDTQVAHSLWLDMSGHGAGFFDFSGEAAEILTRIAAEYQTFDVYAGDDGKIHFEGYDRPIQNSIEEMTEQGLHRESAKNPDEIWKEEVQSEYEDSPAIEKESKMTLPNGIEVEYDQDSNGKETIFLEWVGPLAYRSSYDDFSDDQLLENAQAKFEKIMQSKDYHPDIPEETLKKYSKVKASKKTKATETPIGTPPSNKGGKAETTIQKETGDLTPEITTEGEEVEMPTFKKGQRVYLPNKGAGEVTEISEKGYPVVIFDQGDQIPKEVNPMDLKTEKEHEEGLDVEMLDTGKNQEEIHKDK